MHFLDFSDFRRDVYRSHGRHSGSSAMPLAEVILNIHEIRQKHKTLTISENHNIPSRTEGQVYTTVN